jgi:hypothetical protein
MQLTWSHQHWPPSGTLNLISTLHRLKEVPLLVHCLLIWVFWEVEIWLLPQMEFVDRNNFVVTELVAVRQEFAVTLQAAVLPKIVSQIVMRKHRVVNTQPRATLLVH